MNIKDEYFERFLKANFEHDWRRFTSSDATEEIKYSIMTSHQRSFGIFKRLSDSGLLKNDYIPLDLLSGQLTVEDFIVRMQEYLGQNVVYDNGNMIAVRMQYAENLPNMVYNEDPVKRINRTIELAEKAGLNEKSKEDVVHIEVDNITLESKMENLGISKEVGQNFAAITKAADIKLLLDEAKEAAKNGKTKEEREKAEKLANGLSLIFQNHLKEHNLSEAEINEVYKQAEDKLNKKEAVKLSVLIYLNQLKAKNAKSKLERQHAQDLVEDLTTLRKEFMEEHNIREEDIEKDVKEAIKNITKSDDQNTPPGGGSGNVPHDLSKDTPVKDISDDSNNNTTSHNTDQNKTSIEEDKDTTSSTKDKDKTNSGGKDSYSISAETSHKDSTIRSEFSTTDNEPSAPLDIFEFSSYGISIPSFSITPPSYGVNIGESVPSRKTLSADIAEKIQSVQDCHSDKIAEILAENMAFKERFYKKQNEQYKSRFIELQKQKKEQKVKEILQRTEENSAKLTSMKRLATTTPKIVTSSTSAISTIVSKDTTLDL